MTCFSARVRVYKALLGLDFFDGRWDVFCEGRSGVVRQAFIGAVWQLALSGASPLPHLGGVVALPQERFLAANTFKLTSD